MSKPRFPFVIVSYTEKKMPYAGLAREGQVIIVLSVMPGIIEFVRQKAGAEKQS